MSEVLHVTMPATFPAGSLQTLSREGRAVRRLVVLAEPISDMIAEHDRRELCLREDGVTLETIQAESTAE